MLNEANAYFAKAFPPIAAGLVTDSDADLAPTARDVMEYYVKCHGKDAAQFERALDGLAQLSFDFIRLHGKFLKTGRYRATNSQAFEQELYSQPDRMKDYLDGLLLSYALWPNHVRIYDFMVKDFAANIPVDADIVEIGVGHGLMAATAMKKATAGHYFGFDLSESSLDYCAAMLRANGIGEDRFSMRHVNATDQEAFNDMSSQSAKRRAICCEVLEHVEQPELLLNAIRAFIGQEGEAFVTTVANIDAEDHVYLYENAEQIRKMIADCGMSVVKELSLVVPRYENDPVLPVNYAAIVRVA